MTHGGWKAPSNIPTTGVSGLETEPLDCLARKSARKFHLFVLCGLGRGTFWDAALAANEAIRKPLCFCRCNGFERLVPEMSLEFGAIGFFWRLLGAVGSA